jgi:hypothetical protein
VIVFYIKEVNNKENITYDQKEIKVNVNYDKAIEVVNVLDNQYILNYMYCCV